MRRLEMPRVANARRRTRLVPGISTSTGLVVMKNAARRISTG